MKFSFNVSSKKMLKHKSLRDYQNIFIFTLSSISPTFSKVTCDDLRFRFELLGHIGESYVFPSIVMESIYLDFSN